MSIPIGTVKKRQSEDRQWQPSGGTWDSNKHQRGSSWHTSNAWSDDSNWSRDEWQDTKQWSGLNDMWDAPEESGGSSRASWGVRGISDGDKADIIQWQECSKVGSPLPGTCIVPVKTPFEGHLQRRAVEAGLISPEDAFTKADLLRICEEKGTPIGLVIDLVNTDKYYKGFSERDDGIEYRKVPIPGRQVPSIKDVKLVLGIIDEYMKRRSPDRYVAVHCTHGVNRTGFLTSAYMLVRTPEGRKMSSQEAVTAFEAARGVTMDKAYLVDALKDIVAARPK